MSYIIFDWEGETDIKSLPRKEARERFKVFMKYKDSRVGELKKLLEPELYRHYDVIINENKNICVPKLIKREVPIKQSLDFSIESIQALNEWIYEEAKKYGKSISNRMERFTTQKPFYRCDNKFLRSVATDCAIYIAEMMMKKPNNALYWDMGSSAKTYMARQYPALKGFQNVEYKKYEDGIIYDIFMTVCEYIYRYEIYYQEYEDKEPCVIYRFAQLYNCRSEHI